MLIKLNHRNKKIIFIFGLTLSLVFWAPVVDASTVSWQVAENDNPRQLIFILRLATGNERENAWRGQINFDSSQLNLLAISDAHSLVSLWLERPVEKPAGQINFSGITPGGFLDTGELLRLVFSQKDESVVSVRPSPRLTNFEALLGDGSGRNAKVDISSSIISITDPASLTDLSSDRHAPELTWQFTRENLISAGWQLTTTAVDKQSGIRYLALATTSDYFSFGSLAELNSKINWQPITGPLILSASELRHVMFLKAVDNAGNVKLIKLYPLRAYSFALLCIIIIGLILLLFL